MFNIILVSPDIPQNTGNIIRLCANTGCQLHLIEPLGFPLDSAKMRRAGLDYHEFANIRVYKDWEHFLNQAQPDPQKMFAFTTKGDSQLFHQQHFSPNDWFIFGSETKGLSENIHQFFSDKQKIRLPMLPNNRSLNLANSVAIVSYEAWRQNYFKNGI